MAVYRAIRKEVGNKFPIGIKLNSSDSQPGGFSEEESMQVAELLNNAGIDLTEVSGGNYEALAFSGYEQKESTRVREAYFIEYSERIKSRVDTTLVLSSCFRAKKGMDSALKKSAEDMICLARPLSLKKDLPSKLIYNEHYKITVPSPTTGLKMLDKKVMVDVCWLEQQLNLISRGYSPNPRLNPYIVIVKLMISFVFSVYKKRRL